MKNFGQLWALVLATERTEREANSLLGYVVNRAAKTAHRERVWAVVTQQHRRQLKGPLWFLPASNFIVLPEPASTTFGIIMGLLRIVQRDPAARVVVLPANHDVRNEKPLMRSLRDAAAHTIVRPDDLFILGVEPEAHDLDFPGIVVGRDDRRGAFEVEQLVEKIVRDTASCCSRAPLAMEHRHPGGIGVGVVATDRAACTRHHRASPSSRPRNEPRG